MPLLAAWVAGSMIVQQCEGTERAPRNCSLIAEWHGTGERRDCGAHTFKRDDDVVVRVIVGCGR